MTRPAPAAGSPDTRTDGSNEEGGVERRKETPAQALSRIEGELGALVSREREERPKADRSGDDAWDYVWSAMTRVRHARRVLRALASGKADADMDGSKDDGETAAADPCEGGDKA